MALGDFSYYGIPDAAPKPEPERPSFGPAYAFAPGSYEGPGDPTCGGCRHMHVEFPGRSKPGRYSCQKAALIHGRPMGEIDWRARACLHWWERKRA